MSVLTPLFYSLGAFVFVLLLAMLLYHERWGFVLGAFFSLFYELGLEDFVDVYIIDVVKQIK